MQEKCFYGLFFCRLLIIFTVMKKLIVFAGVLFALTAILESCGPSHKIPRPQVHPRRPRNLTMVMPIHAQDAPVQTIG